MHICHIIADGEAGGGPTVVQTLAEQLRKHEADVSIITQSSSHFLSQATRSGFRTLGVDFARRTKSLSISSSLEELFSRICPNVIHAHGSRSAFPVALIGARKRPPMVYTAHGFHYAHKNPIPRLVFRSVERFCIQRAGHAIFVARAQKHVAEQQGLTGHSGSYSVIYNGVSVEPTKPVPDSERPFEIAFVGRLHRQKNPLLLPEILVALRPLKPRTLIVGSGELETQLINKAKSLGVDDQITFIGAQTRMEALRLMSSARIFVLPSLWEGLPISLVEAMLLEVAVVASDIPGNQEAVEQGQSGFLVESANPNEFAKKIATLMASPSTRLRVARYGASQARKLFSIDSQISAHLQIYKALCAPSSSKS
jgi:glycosyltransferase involved in cell wall biosynthesis